MRINFIGCPASGKTTLAAQIFAYLKEAGYSCEFVPERARYYIAKKKSNEHRCPEERLELNDDDQVVIMTGQIYTETIFQESASEDSYIISDSSAINSLLYMSRRRRELLIKNKLIDMVLKNVDFIFYVPPLELMDKNNKDFNRIHDNEQSKKINKLAKKLIRTIPRLSNQIIPLPYDLHSRLPFVLSVILSN